MRRTPSPRVTQLVALVIAAVFMMVAATPARAADPYIAAPGDLQVILDLIRTTYAGRVTEQQLVEGALRGMMDSLGDPYSLYLSPEELASFSEEIGGEYVGIGITFEMVGGKGHILSIFQDSPAETAGIVPGDTFTAVDGKPIAGLNADAVKLLVRGAEGTPVVLTVLHADGRAVDVKVTRRRIIMRTVSGRAIGDVAYIRISAFYEQTGEQLAEVIAQTVSEKTSGIVLDLRDNGGGLVDQAVNVASQLLPAGVITRLIEPSYGVTTYEAPGPGLGKPIVALVNENTASSAEILAAAVQESGIGMLMGQKTFGKGSVQGIIGVGDAALKLTIAHYVSPRGATIDGLGLTPDLWLKAPAPLALPQLTMLDGTRTLTQGEVGLDVLELQQALTALKIGSIHHVKGGYDADTVAAVRLLQKTAGLKQSGVFGPAEREALLDQMWRAMDAYRQSDGWLDRAVTLIHSNLPVTR